MIRAGPVTRSPAASVSRSKSGTDSFVPSAVEGRGTDSERPSTALGTNVFSSEAAPFPTTSTIAVSTTTAVSGAMNPNLCLCAASNAARISPETGTSSAVSLPS